MNPPPLPPGELEMIRSVFRRHPESQKVKLFGSRAKGTHTAHSDVDLALWGEVDRLRVAQIAAELDELPLPYQYDAQHFESITLHPLREHIEHVGIVVYP